jgi:hypothetical protein
MLALSTDDRSPEEILAAHPLLMWIAWMRKWGSEWAPEPNNRMPRDLMLSPMCSSRLCFSVEDEDAMTMAMAEEDLAALMSVTWEMAAFRRNHKGKDYVILSCSDVAEGSLEAEPGTERRKLRIFIQLSAEMAEAMGAVDPAPSRLHFRNMVRHKQALLGSLGAPKADVPLAYL